MRAGSGVQSGANLCHIFLDQIEARRTEKKIFGVQAPRFAKGLVDRAFPPPPPPPPTSPSPLSQGLDLARLRTVIL